MSAVGSLPRGLLPAAGHPDAEVVTIDPHDVIPDYDKNSRTDWFTKIGPAVTKKEIKVGPMSLFGPNYLHRFRV